MENIVIKFWIVDHTVHIPWLMHMPLAAECARYVCACVYVRTCVHVFVSI